MDRLVLLGDTLELLDGRPREAMGVAATVLPRLGAALGSGGQVVVVPGNHDHALVRPWVRARLQSQAPTPPAARVPRGSSPLLDELCRLLKPARVEVRYPGVWLAPRVYATHGHYVDRHLFAALSAAFQGGARDSSVAEGGPVASRRGSAADSRPVVSRRRSAVADYERSLGADTGALQELLATTLPEPLAGAATAALAGARRTLIASVPRLGAAPGMRGASLVWATLLEHGITRRGALPAMVQVAASLGIHADAIIFGHIHRRGPLASDDPALWRPAGGAGPRLLNCGNWIWDPALVGRGDGPRPYRPGGAVILEGSRAPRPIDVLAEVDDSALREPT